MKEIVVSIVLILLSILIANPFHFWMPNMVHNMALAVLVIVFGVFATIVMREGAEDEREGMHRALAGRMAFLAGSVTLIIGILYQSYSGGIDKWLVATLVIMVVAKISTRLYSDKKL
jgi:hypothetical protein